MYRVILKINPGERVAYFPKQLIQHLGYELIVIPGPKCAVMFSKDSDESKIIRGVDSILENLRDELVDRTRNDVNIIRNDNEKSGFAHAYVIPPELARESG